MLDKCVCKFMFLLLDKLLPHMRPGSTHAAFVDVTARATDVDRLEMDSSS
jgi:hypothetical protein